MSAIQTPAINNITARDISDINGLKKSTQQAKKEILENLGIKKDSSLLSDIKNYIVNLFHTKKIK